MKKLFILFGLLTATALSGLNFNQGNSAIHAEGKTPDSYPVSYLVSYPKENENFIDWDTFLKDKPLLFSKQGKLYRKLNKKDSVLVSNKTGRISQDNKRIAHIDKNNKQSLNLTNIETQLNQEIILSDDSINKFVNSWSPNSNFIVLMNEAHSTGDVKATIYNTFDLKIQKEIDLYDYNLIWIDDSTFYYFDLNKECKNDECNFKGITLNKFELSKNRGITIASIEIGEDKFPQITSFNKLNNQLLILLTSFNTTIPERTRLLQYNVHTHKLLDQNPEKGLEWEIKKKLNLPNFENYKIYIEEELPNSTLKISLLPMIETLSEKKVLIQTKLDEIIEYNILDL